MNWIFFSDSLLDYQYESLAVSKRKSKGLYLSKRFGLQKWNLFEWP